MHGAPTQPQIPMSPRSHVYDTQFEQLNWGDKMSMYSVAQSCLEMEQSNALYAMGSLNVGGEIAGLFCGTYRVQLKAWHVRTGWSSIV